MNFLILHTYSSSRELSNYMALFVDDTEYMDKIILDDKGHINDPANKIFTKAIIEEKKNIAKDKKLQKGLIKSSTLKLENTMRNDCSIVPDCGSQKMNDQRSHNSDGCRIAKEHSNNQDTDNASFSILQHQESFASGVQPSTSKTNFFSTLNMQQVSKIQQNSQSGSQQPHIDQGFSSVCTNVYNHPDNLSTSAGPSSSIQKLCQNISFLQQPQI